MLKKTAVLSFLIIIPFISVHAQDDANLLKSLSSISANSIMNFDKELSSTKFAGRFTGTKGYDLAAEWIINLFKKWGIKPAGDKKTYLQKFPNPYTIVLDAGGLVLNNPDGSSSPRDYKYEEEYYPGATSDKGEITAEVVYVGYGITAPELNYDDYKGIDVKGKLVFMNPEIPVNTDNPELFKKWRPYSFHYYKIKNAAAHGAAGVIYNYHIVNPNCAFVKGLLKVNISKTVSDDIFKGTGKKLDDLLKQIRKDLQPASFNTKKIMTVKCNTKHYPDGMGSNVIGVINGNDPVYNSANSLRIFCK